MQGPNTLQGSAELRAALAMPPAGWDCIEGDDQPYIDDSIDADAAADETDCIDDDDWWTNDGCKFYSGSRLVLDATDMTDAQAARAAGRIMRRERHFPNVWYISDHGNVSTFTFE